ncbi:MAG TPA: DUF465 domain-containing protein [Rhizomicrobium sp.]|jgi:hypothetical protein|nr:DUF465 domain-containing protein [Rhizomicrobium sp.]HEX4533060.1 DUF465 domain-containing protein [Rhizomicrobium sp.]
MRRDTATLAVTGSPVGVLISLLPCREVQPMALQGHIQELSEKHKRLEELIETELTHPDWDEVRIAALKKEKLRIKDELQRLSTSLH